MGEKTEIAWTDATWNPLRGCSRISEGCDHCYAIGVVHRGLQPSDKGLTIHRAGEGLDWSGKIAEIGDRLDQPLRWRKPRMIFVNSLSDLFHADVDERFIADVFAVMALCPQHTFQVLTKRPQRMAELTNDLTFKSYVHVAVTRLLGVKAEDYPHVVTGVDPYAFGAAIRRAWVESPIGSDTLPWPLPNVWGGASIELDKYAFRATHVRKANLAVKILSCEPLLGPLPSINLQGIDWVIAGGESGAQARPMHPQWVRQLRNRVLDERIPLCYEYGDTAHVWQPGEACTPDRPPTPPGKPEHLGPAFFMKQWGEYLPVRVVDDPGWAHGRAYDHPLDGRRGAIIRERAPHRTFRSGETRAMRAGDENGLGVMLDDDWLALKVGKKVSGRELDGVTWNEYPS